MKKYRQKGYLLQSFILEQCQAAYEGEEADTAEIPQSPLSWSSLVQPLGYF